MDWIRPILVDVGRIWHGLDQLWGWDQRQPNPAQVWPGFGQSLPGFAQIWTEFATLGRIHPNFGQFRSTFGRVRPDLIEVELDGGLHRLIWGEFGHVELGFDRTRGEIDRCSADFRQISPDNDQSWRGVGQN